jgi:cellulose biosynthesis protein BcsQ
MAIAETFGVSPPRIHILLTHFDRRIKMSESVFNDLKSRYGNQLIAQPIRTSSSFAQAQEQGKTVFDISKAKKVQADYSFATRALLNLIPESMQATSK